MKLYVRAERPTDMTAAAGSDELYAGLLVPWDKPGRTSLGSVKVPRGAIRLPGDIGRIKVLTEHDRNRPVGVVASTIENDDGLGVRIRFGTTPAALQARQELIDGTRDGLSLDLIDVDLNDAGDTLTGAELIAIGHVTIPAYTDSRAGLAAGHQEEEETMSDEPNAAEQQEITPVEPATDTQTMTAAIADAAPMRPARSAPRSPALELATRLVAARFDGGDMAVASTLRAALADITPTGNGAGNETAGLMFQTLGELWDGIEYQPQHMNMVNNQRLTGAKFGGWVWAVEPAVGDYAGNKAEIPTNAAQLDYREGVPSRISGGHDLDRIYLDLGDPAVIRSYWRNMTESLAEQLDDKRLNAVVTAAGTPGTAADVVSAILAGITAVKRPTYAAVAENQWNAELAKPVDQLPAYFVANNMFSGQRLDIFPTAGLTDQVIVGARGAVNFYTREPPIRLEGVNIAQAGFDAALYSYWGSLEVNGARAKIYNVPPPVVTTAAAGGEQLGEKRRSEK